jgi:hypothetical protein
VTRLKWKLVSVRLEIELILNQDRCTVCTKYTMGSVIVLDAPDGTPRRHGSCQILFRSFLETVFVSVQDRCTVCAERTIGSESFWTHPMVLQGDEAQVEARFDPF